MCPSPRKQVSPRRQAAAREAEASQSPTTPGLDRIVFFSDAVIAIAITLLVLDLRPPEGEPPADLTRWILDLWPNLLGYAVSFWVIALYWVAHHRCYRYVHRYDRRLIYLNFLFLMFIAFMPFPTSLLFSNPTGPGTVALYAGTAAAMGLSLAGLWGYAVRGGFIDPATPLSVTRNIQLYLVLPPLIFLLSIVVALFDSNLAMFSWLLVVPVYLFRRRREHDLLGDAPT